MTLQLVLISLLAVYTAWNLGANDVANSMGTSVGSKALTLTQAIIIAGILEFTGAVIFGREVSSTLATKVANPTLFIDTPQILVQGMIAVLISCGLWLQIATSFGLPVASSHAVVGAITGFSWVAMGQDAIDWNSIGIICLGWLLTPILSGIVAISFYSVLNRWLFSQSDILKSLQEWIPWLSGGVVAIFGVIVFPQFWRQPIFASLAFSQNNLSSFTGVSVSVILCFTLWNQLTRLQKTDFKAEKTILEGIMAQFQVISACFVAFGHGSNDVGNAIAPLAVIYYVWQANTVPVADLTIPYWILIIGGTGIVAGLAVQGKKVIATVGEGIISLVPSRGFCAEIATATTILLASRVGLPVSTSHALVGSIVGIGLVQKNTQVSWKTVKSVILAWAITLPVAAILGAVVFSLLQLTTI
ncbi:MAG: inorganic phosphate transporter [Xenococcaceae cyanobacterium MO_167.B27]|nr:inorganic phosphate transporter [Xenococcaceae cyanobacterium MO_167.B27]